MEAKINYYYLGPNSNHRWTYTNREKDLVIRASVGYTRKWSAKRAALRVCRQLGLEVIDE